MLSADELMLAVDVISRGFDFFRFRFVVGVRCFSEQCDISLVFMGGSSVFVSLVPLKVYRSRVAQQLSAFIPLLKNEK